MVTATAGGLYHASVDSMSDHDRTDEPERAEPEPSPFERCQSLTKRLLHVSKDELREAEARYEDKRRTA